MNYLIVGNGPAALSAAETLRQQDGRSQIRLLSREQESCYSPCPLAEYVEGHLTRAQLFLRDANFYTRLGLDFRPGQPVTRIDPVQHQVQTLAGNRFDYDRLLLAHGARAVVPPIPGLAGTRGVFELKTLADADAILARLPEARQAVVIGSGFIGLEAVQALVRRGLEVSLLESRGHVLPAMLDEEMAGLVQQQLTRHGVQLHLNSTACEVLADAQGVSAVRTARQTLPARLVICAAGVRPELSLLEGSGLACQRGILVNERMQTSDPDIFAAGDVIELQDATGAGQVVPIWPNAVSTGRVAAWNMLGQPRCHPGLEAVNVVRVLGLAVASFGSRQGDHCVRWQDGRGAVRKIILQEGRIAGAQLVGEINGTGVLHELMKKRVAVARFGEALARPGFSYIHAMEPLRTVQWA